MSETVTTVELAQWLGCTDRAIRDYAAKGIIAAASRGRWPLRASVAAVVDHLRAVASQHRSPSAGEDGEPGDFDLTAQRALLAKRQREKTEIELQRLRGELVPVAEVRAAWFKQARSARDQFLSLPDRIIPQIAAGPEQHSAFTLLTDEIRHILESIAREPVTKTTEEADAE